MTELTTLVKAAQQGDKTAFGQIVIRFQDMAYASAYALVGDPGSAQDVAQEAFLDAYLNLAKLREPAAFPGWFRRIVTGHSHRHLRTYPVTLLPIDDTGTLYQTLVAPDNPLDEFLIRQELQNALRLLPLPQATVIALFYVQGYSQQEIAKIIDLLAPLPRGGHAGIFTPLSGVGLLIVLGEIVYAMHALYHGCTVYVFLESDHLHTLDARLPWRELGVDDKMVFVAGHSKDQPAQQQQTVATALSIAEQLRSEGNEVLLLLDSRFALVDGVRDYLKTHTVTTAEAAITTLYHGHHTVGVEPQPLQNLDTVITFAYDRAIQRLYPAIDPVRSTSTLLQNKQFSSVHRQVAAEAKRVLQRYGDLRPPFENHKLGVDALWYIEDDPNIAQDVTRARRLDRFLTQRFFGAEPWTGMVGELVTVEQTIADCQAILTGKADDLPEDAFRFVGTLAQAQEKASGTVHG